MKIIFSLAATAATASAGFTFPFFPVFDAPSSSGCWVRKWSWPNDSCVLKTSCASWEADSGFGESWEDCCKGHCTGTGLKGPHSAPPTSAPPTPTPNPTSAPPAPTSAPPAPTSAPSAPTSAPPTTTLPSGSCWKRKWAFPNDSCTLKAGCANWEIHSGFGMSWQECCAGHCTGTGLAGPNSNQPTPNSLPTLKPTPNPTPNPTRRPATPKPTPNPTPLAPTPGPDSRPKVVFRLDDVQDFFQVETAVDIINTFLDKGQRLSIGVIGGSFFGERTDDFLTTPIQNALSKGSEVFNHGDGADSTQRFDLFDMHTAKAHIKDAEENLFEYSSFVPHENLWNSHTVEALQELGYSVISASTTGSHPMPFDLSGPVKMMPRHTETGTCCWTSHIHHVLTDCDAAIAKDGVCVVMMHPQEFHQGKVSLFELEQLLDGVQQRGWQTATFSDFATSTTNPTEPPATNPTPATPRPTPRPTPATGGCPFGMTEVSRSCGHLPTERSQRFHCMMTLPGTGVPFCHEVGSVDPALKWCRASVGDQKATWCENRSAKLMCDGTMCSQSAFSGVDCEQEQVPGRRGIFRRTCP